MQYSLQIATFATGIDNCSLWLTLFCNYEAVSIILFIRNSDVK